MSALLRVDIGVEALSTDEEHRQYLTFRLGEETFAMGILRVKEIIEYGLLTVVPMMPEFVRGVINLRGRVVPVVDLALRFGRPRTVPGRRTCIVIAEVGEAGEQQEIGIIVDGVNQVLEIRPGDIEPAPSFGARLRTEFIAGMGKMEDRFLIILDITRVLSLEDMSTLAQAAPAVDRDGEAEAARSVDERVAVTA
ncbi:MAG: chemotaxis protein CheW [Gammaproteobacteria bacterium]